MANPFLSQMQSFGFNFAPRGWAKCEGQLLPIAQNSALFSLLGTTYGGDGRTTFGLPDLRGRVTFQFGTGPGLSNYRLGQAGGAEQTTLTVQNLASHNHSALAAAEVAASDKPNALAAAQIYKTQNPDTELRAGTIANSGSGQAFSNIEPYLVVNWCISLTGVFPSRN